MRFLVILLMSFGVYSQVGLHSVNVTLHGVDLYTKSLEIDLFSSLELNNNSCLVSRRLKSESVISGDYSSVIYYEKARGEIRLDGVKRSYYRCSDPSDSRDFKVFNTIGQYLMSADDLKKVYKSLPRHQMLLIVYSSGITRKIIIE